MNARIARRAIVTALVPLFGVMALASPSWASGPKVTKLTPTTGIVGTKVTVTGSSFTGVKSVKFGAGTAKFKTVSSTKLTATVPSSATTGKVTVVTSKGTALSAGVFTVLPSIASFTPSSGIIGSSVTITGGGFTGATAVTFGGVASSYTVNSASSISATVPAGSATGTLAVTTPAGTATTGSNFAVLPHIGSFAPTSGAIGSSVVITGSGFTGVSAVTFNAVSAAYVVNTPTQITATVPLTTTGLLAVTTPAGTATSVGTFVILPSITLSVASGPPTTALTVNGTGFTAGDPVDVYFDSTDMALAGNDQSGTFNGVPFTVPASATPGTHYVTAVERGTGKVAQVSFVVATDWAMYRNTPSHRGSNPFENVVGTSNVGKLFQVWSVNTNGVPTSPAIVGSSMYVGSTNFDVYSFNASTGAQNWAFATTAAVNSSPAVSNGVVYAVSSDGKLWAVNAGTGVATWGSPVTLSGASNSSPTVSGGIVYVGTTTGNLYAIDASTGAVDWTTAPAAGGVTTSPAVANGVVAFATSTGHVVTYNATSSGGLLWNVNPGGALTTPLIANGNVYVGSGNGNAYALSLATGAVLWNDNPSGSAFASAPTYANGFVYLGSNDGNVYQYDTTGVSNWSNGNGTAYQSPVTEANGVLYAGSNDNSVYAFDSSNGTIMWSAATNGQVKASPVIVNGTLYVASNDGHVYVYSLTSTPMLSGIHRPRPRKMHPNMGLPVLRG